MERHHETIGLVAACCMVALAGRCAFALGSIAKDGTAQAVIVVAKDAIAPEKHAAAELASFLKQVTGASFDVVNSAPAGKTRLLVGPHAAKLADKGFTTDGLGAEGIVIRTVGDNLILAGGRPRGTLYAVYTFLEDCVGCRWWSSKASTIPKKPTLGVGPMKIRYVPPLEYRESFWFDASDGDWAVRNKSNGHSVNVGEKRGGKHIYQGFVHTFFPLIPPQKYFKDHPEWFSEINGKRKHERAQLCLTNEEMRAELIKNLKERLRKNPKATIASVSQNDWHGYCTCPKCKAIDEAEGSPAGTMLRFVNAVAEAIEEEFPHVAISTLAYQYTRKPPKITKPRDNVIIRLCSIECSFAVPLEHPRNSKFRDDILGWDKICDRLYIWDYTTNFRHYVLPHPNLRVLAPNVKFFVNHGVKGIFEQGAYQSYGSEMAELKAWVLAKLLWNPKRDGQKLIDEFVQDYYGPAGKYVRAYLEMMHDAVLETGDKLGCFSPADAEFLSAKNLSKGMELLEQAEEAVKDNPDLRLRVQVAQLPIVYACMRRWYPLRQEANEQGMAWFVEDTLQGAYDRFMKVAKTIHMTHISERGGMEQLKQIVNQPKRKACGPPPGCENLSADRWVDFQDSLFRLSKVGQWSKLAADAKASDGVAAYMPGDHHEWAVSKPLGCKLVKESAGKPIRCKIAVRCDVAGEKGRAFTAGIYDPEKRRGVAHLVAQAKDAGGGEYRVYDLGAHKLTPEMYAWVAPAKNPDDVKGVWVDRIWLVRE